MKTYLFRFTTNYEEGGVIITTAKGEEYATELALEKLGAWDADDITIIDTDKEGAFSSVNFGVKDGML